MTDIIGVVGLLAGLAFVIWATSVKNWPSLPATLVGSIIVAVTNGISIWTGLGDFYSAKAGGYVTAWLMQMVAASLLGEAMKATGCSQAVAYKILNIFGEKAIGISLFVMTSLFTLGGVACMPVVFAVWPIAQRMLQKANMPKQLFLAAYGFGAITWTMTCFPGSPQSQNLIPAMYLGTTASAAPTLGYIGSAMFIVIAIIYLRWLEKRFRKQNIGYNPTPGIDGDDFQIGGDMAELEQDLPNWIMATIPLVLALGCTIGFSYLLEGIVSTTGQAVYAILIGTAFCLITQWKRFIHSDVTHFLEFGFSQGANACLGVAGVIGFGAVIQNVPAFQVFVDFCYNMPFSPMISMILAVNIICGVCGSSSGGLTIFMQSMAPTYISMGIDPQVVHRVCSIGCGGMDTLPHNSAVIMWLRLVGLTHKEGYWYLCLSSVLVPLIVTIPIIILATLGVV